MGLPSVVNAELQYYLPNEDGSPPGVNDLEIQYGKKNMDYHIVEVNDMRKKEFTLEKNGFQLVPFETKVTDFSERAHVKEHYYPEIVESLKKSLGAKDVLCIGHTVRTGTQYPDVSNQKNFVDCHGPSRRVHVDVTPVTCEEAVTFRLGKEYMDSIKGRWKLINAWRPIKTVMKDPLAVADAQTVPDEDLVTVKRVFPDGRLEERYMLQRGEKPHGWYYAPEQTPEELLLFTQFNADPNRTIADRVAHAAFTVPGTENNASRESLEVRCIVSF